MEEESRRDGDKNDFRGRSARKGIRPGNGISTTMTSESKLQGRGRYRGMASGTTTTITDGKELGARAGNDRGIGVNDGRVVFRFTGVVVTLLGR